MNETPPLWALTELNQGGGVVVWGLHLGMVGSQDRVWACTEVLPDFSTSRV